MAKLRNILIGIAITSFVILSMGGLAIATVFWKFSWWWLGGLAIFEGIALSIFGLVIVYLKLIGIQPTKQKIDSKSATEKFINEVKYDNENPDNLILVRRRISREGETNTPLLVIEGVGSETNTNIVGIINLNNPKETTRLDNADKIEIDNAIIKMAESPVSEITESVITGVDAFGRATQKSVITKISEREKQEIKDEAESEKASTL